MPLAVLSTPVRVKLLLPENKKAYMRKLIVSMNVTLDGYMAGQNCELDWHFQRWSTEMGEALAGELSKVDTILFGKTTFLAMQQYWSSKAVDGLTSREDIAFTEAMNQTQKLVFSHTLKKTSWINSSVISKRVEESVPSLKLKEGRDLIVYGSGKMVGSLIESELVDEYQLWMHPVVLGLGKPLFKNLSHPVNLDLYKTTLFRSGVVLLYYRTNASAKVGH